MSPLRIGFLPFYVSYYEGICRDFPVEKAAICARLCERLREFGEVRWDGHMICDEAQATAAGRTLTAERPDCVVAFTSIAVFSAIPMAALEGLDCPILIWNAQQIESVGEGYTMEEIVRNTGQIGAQALANVLMRSGRAFRVITGFESSRRTQEQLEMYFGSVRAASQVRGARLLAVGSVFPSMGDVLIDRETLRRELGIEIVAVPPESLTRAYLSVADHRVARHVEDLRSRSHICNATEDEARRSVQLAEALADLAESERVSGGTLNCHGVNCLRNPAIGVTACYALGVQNLADRPFTCTGDLPTAIAMLILKRFTGVAMYTEVQVMDEARGAVVIANSGEGEPGLCRSRHRCSLRGNTNFSGLHGRGLSFAHALEPGPATLVSFTPSPAGPRAFRLIVAEGEILDEILPDAGALAGFFRFRGLGLHEGYTRWLEAGPVHHAATTRGHLSSALRDVAGWLGIEFVAISPP